MEAYTFRGMPASKGYGIGEIFILEQAVPGINKVNIKDGQIESELFKLEKAIDKTLIEIFDLKNEIRDRLSEREKLIFEAYQSILEDRYFIREIRDIVTIRKFNAEYAVDVCIQNYINIIEESANEYAKQRVHDLNDIKTRVIKNIGSKDKKQPIGIFGNPIVAVEEITPSLAGILCRQEISGVVAQKGAGYLSHAAIILRGLGIPTLNDIDFKELKKFNENFAIIDGDEGLLMVNPIADEIEKYREKLISNSERQRKISHEIYSPATTLDGRRIGLHANISNIKEYNLAANKSVDGIGLVRTEMLFFNSKKMPNEKEQVYIYSRIARRMDNKPVIIRTVDIGGDKIPVSVSEADKGPFKNLRGIRRSLAQKEQLKTQIRSIMRASGYGNVSISFPMVNNAEEVREVKKLMEEVRQELNSEGIKTDENIRTGVIVETKSAVENIESIVSEVDFISIGTNDLFQQVMDRERESTEGKKCEYCDPEFLKIIKKCINEALKQKKIISVCGEMAADPMSSIILIGMGVNDLSITPSKLVNINHIIRRISFEDAANIAQRAVNSETSEDVKNILLDWTSKTGYDYFRD